MRWGLNRERGEWTTRLSALGLQLDGQARPLRDVAIAVTGTEVWVTALALSTTRLTYGHWIPFALHLTGGEPVVGVTPGAWSARLAAVGMVLDGDPRPVHDPCVVQVAAGFVVSALVAEPVAGWSHWRLATWRSADAP